MKQKIIIEHSRYWKCENMDLLADIIEDGDCFLLNDNTIEYNPSDVAICIDFYRKATEEEYREYYHKQGSIFVGDEVVIVKGIKIPSGEKKIVKTFYDYKIPNTYNKYVLYVIFEDGTKTNIEDVRAVGFEDVKYVHRFSKRHIGGRV